jgi:hypothetical protein
MSSRPELRLDWCTHEAAKYACEKWHYSKSMPLSKTAKIGVWENRIFVGCVIFSTGAGPTCFNSCKRFSLPKMSFCELQRVALNDHVTPVSKIISVALKLLKKEFTGLKCVISYADPYQNHHGGIYQAGNWYYVGVSAATPAWYDKVSKKYVHDRNVTPNGMVKVKGVYTKCSKLADCRREERPAKHKYLMPLDDEMRKQIEPLRKPYPKRVRSEVSGTIGSQPIGGGATPTRTLIESVE